MESSDITKKELEQLNTKMDLGNIVDNRDAFYQENEQFQGKEVEVIRRYICTYTCIVSPAVM